MNQHSIERLKSVHPQLAAKINQMAEMLKQEGIDFEVVQGLRTWSEQDALYQQGRTTPGNIVTNAPAGSSWHNFGLAVDCCPYKHDGNLQGTNPDKVLDWNPSHPVWQRMISVGESLGLYSGSEFKTFKDWPHFQLTGTLPVSPNDEVRQTFLDAGMQAVWDSSGLQSDTVNA